MAQGNHKLGKAKRSGGSQRRKSVKAVKKARKGSANIENNKHHIATSKAINRKNERIVAAKAMSRGTNFFMNEISTRGKSEYRRQNAARDKKQNSDKKLNSRLQAQLSKLR